MLPPSPLIPMKALKATGILLMYLLAIVGAVFCFAFSITFLSIYMSVEDAMSVIALCTFVLMILAVLWLRIYQSL